MLKLIKAVILALQRVDATLAHSAMSNLAFSAAQSESSVSSESMGFMSSENRPLTAAHQRLASCSL